MPTGHSTARPAWGLQEPKPQQDNVPVHPQCFRWDTSKVGLVLIETQDQLSQRQAGPGGLAPSLFPLFPMPFTELSRLQCSSMAVSTAKLQLSLITQLQSLH